MITVIFTVMMLMVFVPLLKVAVKMAWGIAEVLTVLVFLPVLLIAFAAAGLFYIAMPILAAVGVVALIRKFAVRG